MHLITSVSILSTLKLLSSAIMLSFARGSGREQLLYVIRNRTTSELLFLFPSPRFDFSCPSYLLQWKSEKYTHLYTNSVDMQIKSDWQSCRIQHKSCECIAPVCISNSLCAPYCKYGSIKSIEVAVRVHCASRFIKLMVLSEINDHTNQPWLPCKVGHIYWSKYFALQSSIWNHRPRGYSHQPVVECQFENSHLHCL